MTERDQPNRQVSSAIINQRFFKSEIEPDPTRDLPREDQFGKDTRDRLEKLGFTVIRVFDTHYEVELPSGLREKWSSRLPRVYEIEDTHSALVIREETTLSGKWHLRFFDQDNPTE